MQDRYSAIPKVEYLDINYACYQVMVPLLYLWQQILQQ